MFIKLTRTDGRPIWINPEFVVTVEGRQGGGAIVVPAGDGLDYDVKESPDAVMRLCGGGEPLPAAEQPTAEPAEPMDVLPMQDAPERPVADAEATVQALREKVKRIREAAAAKTDRTPPNGKDAPPGKTEAQPPAEDAKPKTAAKPRKRASRSKKPAIDLTDEQMERLKKMAPSSRQKLLNTLAHLKVPNAEATAVALLAHKVIEMTPDNHVSWRVQ